MDVDIRGLMELMCEHTDLWMGSDLRTVTSSPDK